MTELSHASTDTQKKPSSEPREQPVQKPRGGGFAKWRARTLVLAMIAGAVYGGEQMVAAKTAESAQLDLGTVTLTAQPVSVESAFAGQVTTISVRPLQRVTAGQQLGTLLTTAATATGKTVHKTVSVTAPSTGVVSNNPAAVGSSLQTGQPLVVLYDPAQLTLLANVPVSEISHLSPGMSATLRTPGLSKPVDALVEQVMPWVATSGSTASPNYLRVILAPKHPEQVTGLLPGVRFTGTVDTRSAPKHSEGAEMLVSK